MQGIDQKTSGTFDQNHHPDLDPQPQRFLDASKGIITIIVIPNQED